MKKTYVAPHIETIHVGIPSILAGTDAINSQVSDGGHSGGIGGGGGDYSAGEEEEGLSRRGGGFWDDDF